MNPTPHRALWSTASMGAPPLSPWTDATQLSEHLGGCRTLSSRLFALHCAADSARHFMAEHFATTLVVVLLVLLGLRWGVL
jgi:hypothetical protein